MCDSPSSVAKAACCMSVPQVLMAWRDNLTCDTVPEAVQELAKALAMADLARKSTLVLKLDGIITTLIV